jgi:hypothetical protein
MSKKDPLLELIRIRQKDGSTKPATEFRIAKKLKEMDACKHNAGWWRENFVIKAGMNDAVTLNCNVPECKTKKRFTVIVDKDLTTTLKVFQKHQNKNSTDSNLEAQWNRPFTNEEKKIVSRLLIKRKAAGVEEKK